MSVYTDETFTVYYVALDRTSGLVDVELRIRKPDNSVAGVFIMTEQSGMNGTYYYEYTPDLEGDYLFEANSISKPKKFSKAFSFVSRPLDRIPILKFR